MRWKMIDRLLRCEPGVSAVAEKCFDPEEPLFRDHFPGWATVPGVLQIEMIAATGGKALRLARPDRLSVLAAVKNAKFRRPVAPGDLCVVHAEIQQLREHRAAAEGHIEVDGHTVCQATILYGFRPLPHGFDDPALREFSGGKP